MFTGFYQHLLDPKLKNKIVLILVFVFSLLFQSRHLTTPAFTAYDWRQWDTFSVIRNFRAEGMNILEPRTNQIYVNEPKPNERLFLLDFPIYTYLSSLMTFLVGVSPIAPRIINLLSAGVVSALLFAVIKKIKFGNIAAISAVILLNIAPLFQFSTSSIQPDMFMLSFFSYWLYLFLTKKDHKPLGLTALSIAVLIKPYMFLVALPALIWDYLNDKGNKKHLFIIFIPPFLYCLWLLRGLFSQSGNYWYQAQTWVITFINSWSFNLSEITLKLFIKVITTIVTIPILFLAIKGLRTITHSSTKFYLLFLGFLINILIFIPGNFNHAYYQLPILFPIYLLAGIGITAFKVNKDIWYLVVLITIGAYLYLIPSGKFYKELFNQHNIYLKLKDWQFTQTAIPTGKTVIYFNDEVSPVLLNMMGRNGWVYKIADETCDAQIEKITKMKPDYALIFNSYIGITNTEKQSEDSRLIKCISEFTKSTPKYKDDYITVFKTSST